MAVFLSIVILFAAILLLFFWLRQFFDLMARSDDTFPGKHDKLIWVVVLLLTNIFGAFLYLIFRLQEDTTETTKSERPGIEHPRPCLKCGKTIPSDTPKCPYCGWSYNEEMDEKD